MDSVLCGNLNVIIVSCSTNAQNLQIYSVSGPLFCHLIQVKLDLAEVSFFFFFSLPSLV